MTSTESGTVGERRRVLLTGAAGRIGRAFRQHAGDRYALRLADRALADGRGSAPGDADQPEIVAADLAVLDACRQACAGIDTVVHLAADASSSAEFYPSLLDNNVKATYNVFQAASEAGCRRVVFASSVHAVWGYPDEVQVHPEMLVRPATLYGVTKCFGEAVARCFAETGALSVVCIRIGYFDPQPLDAPLDWRDVSMAITPRDLTQLIVQAIETPDLAFALVHGISDNRFKAYDITSARELLGYVPEDDAFELFGAWVPGSKPVGQRAGPRSRSGVPKRSAETECRSIVSAGRPADATHSLEERGDGPPSSHGELPSSRGEPPDRAGARAAPGSGRRRGRGAPQRPSGGRAGGAGLEALALPGTPEQIFTPTSGTLLVGGERQLFRSDDGGLTWRPLATPPEARVLTVSPFDHDRLYAARGGVVLRSQDGGTSWQEVPEQEGRWSHLEVSPADPSTLYGVAITEPPGQYARNLWHEFRVSHDDGTTWEVVRTYKDRVLPGSHPCFYSVPLLQPHGADPQRVVTIEGCVGRGMDPEPRESFTEGRTTRRFPEFDRWDFGAHAVVGGRGVDSKRWYVALFRAGSTYTRVHHSQVLRSDDDGATWTTVLESTSGEPKRETVQPADVVRRLAYDPARPDHVFAVTRRWEPTPGSSSIEFSQAGFALLASRDGGTTWTDLGASELGEIGDLAVGVDGHHLFVAARNGLFRLALSA